MSVRVSLEHSRRSSASPAATSAAMVQMATTARSVPPAIARICSNITSPALPVADPSIVQIQRLERNPFIYGVRASTLATMLAAARSCDLAVKWLDRSECEYYGKMSVFLRTNRNCAGGREGVGSRWVQEIVNVRGTRPKESS